MSTPKRGSIPKLCGADVELCNFILGRKGAASTGREASRALLREIDGVPDPGVRGNVPKGYGKYRSDRAHRWGEGSWKSAAPYGWDDWGSGASFHDQPGHAAPYDAAGYAAPTENPQDWGRKFLASNGGCVYIDLDHLEVCVPEVVSAYDHVAAWHAMLRIAHGAKIAADQKLPDGQRLQLIANNSDGRGHAYGSHLNYLITRSAWTGIFERKLHHLLFLASYQVSSIVFTGQGKVGSENGHAPVDFQLTQRGDFFETLVGRQTTYRRPIVNSRDEPLCGPRTPTVPGNAGAIPSASAADMPYADPTQMARLHVIFYDSGLCHVAALLRVGVLQIVLAMIEAGAVDSSLVLDDPLGALHDWGHDPDLKARARLSSGGSTTAIELQMRFFDAAQGFVTDGGCDGIVPRAEEILELWGDTLEKLSRADFDDLAARLDWVLKRAILRRTMERHPQLDWQSPEIKHLDFLYASLDPDEGLYWAYERTGAVERVASDKRIARFVTAPPDDTRAYARSMLLRLAGPGSVEAVDWDSIDFRTRASGERPRYHSVQLDNPLAATREQLGPVFERLEASSRVDSGGGLDALLRAIEGAPDANRVAPARPSNTSNQGSSRKPTEEDHETSWTIQ